MGIEEAKSAPLPTIRRLPVYLRFLKMLRSRGREVVSCTHIAEDLKLDPTQIRKDLTVTGIVGRPKVGYLVEELIGAIETFLGWNNNVDAVLVGVGSLGRALMGYERFNERQGLRILAGFDADENKVGQTVNEKPVFSLTKLADLVQRMHIHIGIITVPAAVAQEVADLLVGSGIRAIWNFTPTALQVPDEVLVENVDLASSFAVLSARLTAATNQKEFLGGNHVDADAASVGNAAQI